MTQTDLFAPPSTIDAAFWKFHRENPLVYNKLVELARQARASHKRKIGIGMLFEVLRWNHMIQTRGDHFKLNNNFRSRYVRLISEKHPELADLFETRKLSS